MIARVRGRREAATRGGDTLEISVVIPTRDRPAALRRCLDALAAQDLARASFEVRVVDDGSRVDLASALAGRDPSLRLVLERQAPAGPAAARNRGWRGARAPLVAFTDDDCAPEPGWLRALLGAAGRSPRALLGGHTANALAHNPYAEASQQLVTYLYRAFGDRSEAPRFFASNNLAAPRELLDAVGGFDAGFPRPAAEDRDLCDRWLQAGLPMVLVDDARVWHHHDLDLRGFVRQHLDYGRGACRFRQARLRRGARPLPIERPGFYAGLICAPLAAPGLQRPLTISALVAAAQAAHAVGFALELGAPATVRAPR